MLLNKPQLSWRLLVPMLILLTSLIFASHRRTGYVLLAGGLLVWTMLNKDKLFGKYRRWFLGAVAMAFVVALSSPVLQERMLLVVSEIQQLNIVNWPVEASPFVDIEDAASEDILNFKCAYCNIDIKVLDGWNSIVCPGCKKVIERDKVIGSNGKYIMIKTKI